MRAFFKSAAPYAQDALRLPVANVDAAVPHYERVFGFRVVSRRSEPHPAAILERDSVRIGLEQNGGDPEQEGCFFEVDNVEAAFEEITGRPPDENSFKIHRGKGAAHRAFFHIAPDKLCYMIGETVSP